ncbi:MAG: cyclic nucleotide-binding domain-containing protein [Candidatus Schekmanbacteria bacterium]|nr:cyclic nucleotide-binding domain-containing protein [Candidatus Schekmanbacteria bacterium]
MVTFEDIKNVPLFAGLDEQALAALAPKLQLLRLPKGTFLYNQNTVEPTLYIIKEGVVRLTTGDTGKGAPQTVGILRSPEFLGELSLIDGQAPVTAAEVIKEAQIIVLRKPDFETFLEANPPAGYSIYLLLAKEICARLRKLNDEFIDMTKFVWEMSAKI